MNQKTLCQESKHQRSNFLIRKRESTDTTIVEATVEVGAAADVAVGAAVDAASIRIAKDEATTRDRFPISGSIYAFQRQRISLSASL